MRIAVVVAGWALALPAGAQEVVGYAEVLGVGQIGVDGVPVQAVERLRPEFSFELEDRVLLVAAVEATLTQGRDLGSEVRRTLEESSLGPLLDLAGCTWPEDENEALGVSRVADYLAVDRLYLDLYAPGTDVRVGRQALHWGSAYFFNPTDPFPEVLLTTPWANRRGVNAVRVTVPLGGFSNQVQMVAGTDDTFTRGRFTARATLNALGTDLSVIGAYRGDADDGLIGLDVRGTAGVGFWFEGAVHGRPLAGPSEVWEELAVGIDYSFPVLDSLLVAAQYYRNGAGSDDAVLLDRLPFEPPDCEAFPVEQATPDPYAPFVSKRNYGLVTASLAVDAYVTANLAVLHGFDDGTGMVLPQVGWRPTGALTLTLFVQLPYDLSGSGGEFRPSPEDLAFEVPAPVPVSVDLSGLVPEATAIAWARLDF